MGQSEATWLEADSQQFSMVSVDAVAGIRFGIIPWPGVSVQAGRSGRLSPIMGKAVLPDKLEWCPAVWPSMAHI